MSDPFDRVVRAAANRGRAAGVCPDAEVLAAYLDNGLTSAERATVEAHAAECLTCQQHLALLGAVSVERADPDAAAARPWLVRWGWLVPVATAVLVIAVWTRAPSPVDAPAQFPQREVAPAVVPGAEEPAAPPTPRSDDGVVQQRRSPPPDLPITPPLAKREATPAERQDFAAKAERDAAETAPPPPARPAAPPAAAEADRVGPLADAAPAPAQAEAKESGAGTASQRQEARLMRKAAAPVLEATVAAGERYRALGGRIERSTDGGTSWQEIFGDPSLTFTALACAPGGACWFGTSSGVVLRTGSSGLFRSRLPAPAPVTGISATSATEAIVTAGSQRYSTSDGSSWTPLP